MVFKAVSVGLIVNGEQHSDLTSFAHQLKAMSWNSISEPFREEDFHHSYRKQPTAMFLLFE